MILITGVDLRDILEKECNPNVVFLLYLQFCVHRGKVSETKHSCRSRMIRLPTPMSLLSLPSRVGARAGLMARKKGVNLNVNRSWKRVVTGCYSSSFVVVRDHGEYILPSTKPRVVQNGKERERVSARMSREGGMKDERKRERERERERERQ